MTGTTMDSPAALARLVIVPLLLAAVPLAWWAWRRRGAGARTRLAALTLMTAFLTFDLIVFGAFTRLADAGLGCPDWPGCYGAASPLGARTDIAAAQAALPDGPVTWGKAWIEMVHRYLAMTVGVLIVAATALALRHRRALPAGTVGMALLTLAWVVAQGLFGKYTVTWKLYPAIVTLHLLGGMGLLALLVAQHARLGDGPRAPLPLARPLVVGAAALLALQIALGGWVSTNYAVLACSGFPTCNGQWWPDGADFARGFVLRRPLGEDGQGAAIGTPALVAIHWVHRQMAWLVLASWLVLAWRLRGGGAQARRLARVFVALAVWQFASGLSNVVLGWPLAAALAHNAGAAAATAVMTWTWMAQARAVSKARAQVVAVGPTVPRTAESGS